MLSDFLVLTDKAAELLDELYEKAIEVEALCMQAPIIWDAETNDDLATAKRGCNGSKGDGISSPIPPCPLRSLCLEAAIESNSMHGVWGGRSPSARMKMRAKRNRLTKSPDGSL